MGYTTEFEGELKFKKELTVSQLAYLKTFLGQDIRDLKLEKDDDEYWYHIDLELTDDFTGLRWDGAEKTYGLNSIVNFITQTDFAGEYEGISEGITWIHVVTDDGGHQDSCEIIVTNTN